MDKILHNVTQRAVLIAATATLAVAIVEDDARAGQLILQELSLFDEGEEVGDVSFIYRDMPFEGTFTEGTPPFESSLTLDADQDLRLVEEITVNVVGNTFNRGGSGAGSGTFSFVEEYFWTPLDSTAPNAVVGPREVVVSGASEFDISVELSGGDDFVPLGDGWFFGSSRGDFFALERDGTWNSVIFENLDPGEDPFFGSGTWELASPPAKIPEPTTIIGSLFAGVFGSALWQRCRLSRHTVQ